MRMNALAMLAVFLGAIGTSVAQAPGTSKFEAGKHYQVITPAQPTSGDTTRERRLCGRF